MTPTPDPSVQSETSRSPLYEKARAVVDAAYNRNGLKAVPDIATAVKALEAELAEIDRALVALDELRGRDLAEDMRRGRRL